MPQLSHQDPACRTPLRGTYACHDGGKRRRGATCCSSATRCGPLQLRQAECCNACNADPTCNVWVYAPSSHTCYTLTQVAAAGRARSRPAASRAWGRQAIGRAASSDRIVGGNLEPPFTNASLTVKVKGTGVLWRYGDVPSGNLLGTSRVGEVPLSSPWCAAAVHHCPFPSPCALRQSRRWTALPGAQISTAAAQVCTSWCQPGCNSPQMFYRPLSPLPPAQAKQPSTTAVVWRPSLKTVGRCTMTRAAM